jgi:hypothetical protein
LLPKLQVLQYFGNFDPNNVEMTSMLSARWRAGIAGTVARLWRVNFETYFPFSPEQHAISEYRQLITQGLELSIKTSLGKWTLL